MELFTAASNINCPKSDQITLTNWALNLAGNKLNGVEKNMFNIVKNDVVVALT